MIGRFWGFGCTLALLVAPYGCSSQGSSPTSGTPSRDQAALDQWARQAATPTAKCSTPARKGYFNKDCASAEFLMGQARRQCADARPGGQAIFDGVGGFAGAPGGTGEPGVGILNADECPQPVAGGPLPGSDSFFGNAIAYICCDGAGCNPPPPPPPVCKNGGTINLGTCGSPADLKLKAAAACGAAGVSTLTPNACGGAPGYGAGAGVADGGTVVGQGAGTPDAGPPPVTDALPPSLTYDSATYCCNDAPPPTWQGVYVTGDFVVN
jgi:hypothetical protein